jgi:hypothetical protein
MNQRWSGNVKEIKNCFFAIEKVTEFVANHRGNIGEAPSRLLLIAGVRLNY